MEELELSEQCRLGNNQARKELYEQYAGRMLGICLRYTGDRDTAQVWGIERSGFFNGQGKWAKGFENQMV